MNYTINISTGNPEQFEAFLSFGLVDVIDVKKEDSGIDES